MCPNAALSKTPRRRRRSIDALSADPSRLPTSHDLRTRIISLWSTSRAEKAASCAERKDTRKDSDPQKERERETSLVNLCYLFGDLRFTVKVEASANLAMGPRRRGG